VLSLQKAKRAAVPDQNDIVADMARNLVWVLTVLLVAGGLFLFFQPVLPQTSKGPEHKTFDLVVENHTLVSGPSTLVVKQGDTVTINITVDESEELHLHGYDFTADLPTGKGSLTFEASVSGRFPYELEQSKIEIGALEVQP
jgi:hypothetical protein